MMHKLETFAVVTIFTVAAAGAACASKSDVPDQTKQKRHNYRSTQGASSTNSASGDQASDSTKSPKRGGQQAGKRSGGIPEATGPIAHIDGEPIPADRFNEEIQRIAESGQFPKQLLGQFSDAIVEKIINKQLIEEAISKADIEVTDKQVDKRMKEIRKEYKAMAKRSGEKSPGSLEEYIKGLGISAEDFEKSVRESLKIEALLRERGMSFPTEEEVKKFYDKNKKSFEQSERIRARHILIKVPADAADAKWEKARKKAMKIRKQAIEDGTDFAELAKKKSEHPSGKEGGDLGFFAKGDLSSPEFEKAAFSLEKGQVSEPVKTPIGYHVIKVVEKKEARTVPFEEVKTGLESRLKNQRIQKALKKLVQDLRNESKVETHLDNIE